MPGLLYSSLPRLKDRIRTNRITTATFPCPRCGIFGHRINQVETMTRDLGFRERVWIKSVLGIYRAQCLCSVTFQAEDPEAPPRWKFSRQVRECVVNGIVRDRMSVQRLLERMKEDFFLEISEGFVFECLAWADEEFDLKAHFESVAGRFSGTLCIDELYDGDIKVVFATDPVRNETVGFRVVKSTSRAEVEPFLVELRERGIAPTVVITDDSPLYPEMLQAVWTGVEHQTCVFHFLQGAGKAVLKAVRQVAKTFPAKSTEKSLRPVKGSKDPKRVTTRAFISKNRFLIVKKQENLSAKELEILPELLACHPDLPRLRRFTESLHGLFEPDISQRTARLRRSWLVAGNLVAAFPSFKAVYQRLEDESFNKLIGYMRRDDGERTSNHVERLNRGFRLIQKTRYRHRTTATVERAIRLDISYRARRAAKAECTIMAPETPRMPLPDGPSWHSNLQPE